MTILELQKRLQEMYEKYGDIEVAILENDSEEISRDIKNVEHEGECPNEIIFLS